MSSSPGMLQKAQTFVALFQLSRAKRRWATGALALDLSSWQRSTDGLDGSAQRFFGGEDLDHITAAQHFCTAGISFECERSSAAMACCSLCYLRRLCRTADLDGRRNSCFCRWRWQGRLLVSYNTLGADTRRPRLYAAHIAARRVRGSLHSFGLVTRAVVFLGIHRHPAARLHV